MNMIKTHTLHAYFDGKVLRPEESIGLKPNFRYLITIEDEEPIAERDIWDVLSESSGKIDGPEDWSEEHDHYLYGTQKQQKEQ